MAIHLLTDGSAKPQSTGLKVHALRSAISGVKLYHNSEKKTTENVWSIGAGVTIRVLAAVVGTETQRPQHGKSDNYDNKNAQ